MSSEQAPSQTSFPEKRPATRPEGLEASPVEATPQEAVPLISGREPPSTTVLPAAEDAPAAAPGTASVRRHPRKSRRSASTSSTGSIQSSKTLQEAPTSRQVSQTPSHAPEAQPSAVTGRSQPATRLIKGPDDAMQPLGHRSQQGSGYISGSRQNSAKTECRQCGYVAILSPLGTGGVVDNRPTSKAGVAAKEAAKRDMSHESAVSGARLSEADGYGVTRVSQDTGHGPDRWAQFRHPPATDVKTSDPPPTMRERDWTKPFIAVSALATASIVVAVVLTVFLLPHGNGTHRDSRPVCSTADCVGHGYIIGINRSRGTAPCDDFGRFVCSGWTGKYGNLAFSVRAEAIADWIEGIMLSSLRVDKTATVLDRPLRMMRDCVERDSDNDDRGPVQELLNFVKGRIFSWPTRDWDEDEVVPSWKPLRALIELAVLWGLPLWFRVDLLPKTMESRRVRVVVSPSPLATIFRRIQNELMVHEEVYSYYVKRFIESIYNERPAARAYETFLRGSAKMQSHVFGNLSDAADSSYFVPKIVTIPGLTSIANLSPKDWKVALQDVNGLSLTSKSLLLITNDMILQAMNTIFRTYTAREIWFHTSWWFVQIMGPTTSDALFNEAAIHPLGKSYQSILCAVHVDASYGALLTAALKTRLPDAERRTISSVMRSIEGVTLAKVRSSSRLNPETRSALEDMINKTRTVLWPDEHLGSIEKLEKFYGLPYNNSRSFFLEWLRSREHLQRTMNTSEYTEATSVHRLAVNRLGWYNAALGVISMSVALLAPPFYSARGTSAMLYAGLGYIYAEELLYALNSMLCLLKDGKILPRVDADTRRALWSAPCPIWCPYIKGSYLLFPGLQAVDIAYAAYVRDRDEDSDLPIKGLESYSADQLFFITACHAGCRGDRKGTLSNQACATALKKFVPFVRAFSCSESSDMDAFEKCHYF
ncbi:hypothetical protein V5799_009994 [Amblyomma americanum]|uniref:Peptidase M13 N-terminal domain-containing protein n=1 Tax=Amblyomma americanum TaxID=6943 RepID=A0AAQ4FA78_AMBAM